MLSDIAINDPKAFTELVSIAKKGKEGKIKASEVKTTSEVKTAEKKETKKEEKTDYSKMTVAELKEVAKSKNIATTGMKKADIIEALEK